MNESLPREADVVVAGGGPAGSTIATLLAKLGYSVVLLEARRFPRPHIGESLTPAVLRLFEFLEIGELVERADFVRMRGHTVHWNGSADTYPFADEFDQPTLGFQVWRTRFDQLLIDRARDTGVRVFHGVRAIGTVDVDEGGGTRGVRYVEADGHVGTIDTRLVVDATGHGGVLARGKRWRCLDAPARSLSLWAYWEGAGDLPDDDAFNTFVESFEHGWIWSVRSRPDFRNVTINVDLDDARPRFLEGGLTEFYVDSIRRCEVTRQLLRRATRSTRVLGCDTTWYHSHRYGEPGLIVIGDAATLIDPLTSQGVRKALTSAINGAIVAHTVLSDAGMGAVAWAFQHAQEERAYQRYRRETARALSDETRFANVPYWQRRSRASFGDLGQDPPPARRGLLRDHARDRRLQDIVPRWAPDTRVIDGAIVSGPRLQRERLLVNAQRPEGRHYPGLDASAMFEIMDGRRPITEIVDTYIGRCGSAPDIDRATVMTYLERLVEDWLCEIR